MKNKLISMFVLMIGLILLLGVKVNAGGGNDPFIIFYNDNDYKSVYLNGTVQNEMKNASYDKKTNTLTIKNLSTDMVLQCYGMGSDFKLKVVGNNSIGWLYTEVTDDKKLCSVSIIGDGTITINKDKKYENAIYVGEWDGKSKLSFGKNVTVNMYAEENVVGLYGSALDKDAIVFENSQNNINVKKETVVIEWDQTKTIEAYDFSKEHTHIWGMKNSKDTIGKYGTTGPRYNSDGSIAYFESIGKYEYNEKYGEYLEVEHIGGYMSEKEAKEEGLTWENKDDYFYAYNLIKPYIYKDKNGKEYAVMNAYEKVYDIIKEDGLKYPKIVENKSIKKEDLQEVNEHIRNVIDGRYNYKISGTYLQVKGIPTPKVSVSKTAFTYNKKVQKPSITVKDSNGKTIDSSNYKVTYSNKNSKNVGSYSVKVTFTKKYTGTFKYTYKINPEGVSLKKLKKGNKQFKATWSKNKTQTTGYEVQYSTDKKFKKGNKTVTIKKNKTTSTTVKKLKAKKKYYVRIRTYKTVSGKKYYSSWSKSLNIKTK